jgi:hypothetical protein
VLNYKRGQQRTPEGHRRNDGRFEANRKADREEMLEKLDANMKSMQEDMNHGPTDISPFLCIT